MSTHADFWTFLLCNSMHYLVLSYLCWLKATDTDRAIGKYLIGRTLFLNSLAAGLRDIRTWISA